MTSERAVRRRDATRTRADLLAAAAELFGHQGYSSTTLRAIGERAGADPALIARYFGNKEALYFEAIGQAPPIVDHGEPGRAMVIRMIERARGGGMAPVVRIGLVGTEDDAVRAKAAQVLAERITDSLEAALSTRSTDRADLRAQLATAAVMGVASACSSGVLPALAAASKEELIALCIDAVDAVLDVAPDV